MTIQEFFGENPKCAIAFSGGVDSSYLLYAAQQCRADVRAYYVKSAFQPEFELEDAKKLASQLHADMKIIPVDVLSDETVRSNPKNRCYFCKQVIFSTILKEAAKDGYTVILDGTNASDDAGDRPGMKALQEMKVLSPLRLCGLTKSEIRRLSKEAGLFTWDKPAYACLATRVRTGESITNERLAAIEESEDYLFSRGYTDFRVRTEGKAALLQFPAEQLERAKAEEAEIAGRLRVFFESIHIDPEGRKTGL